MPAGTIAAQHVPTSPTDLCCWRLPTGQCPRRYLGAHAGSWTHQPMQVWSQEHCFIPQKRLQQPRVAPNTVCAPQGHESAQLGWQRGAGWGRGFLQSCKSSWSHDFVQRALYRSIKPWLRIRSPFWFILLASHTAETTFPFFYVLSVHDKYSAKLSGTGQLIKYFFWLYK